ncbi:MAG: cardiolipin synthase [Planctomycetota bacterium]
MLDGWTIAGLLYALFEISGVLSAMHVLMHGRTPQGAIAWLLFLLAIPPLAVPLYWIFGPRKYANYVDSRLKADTPFDPVVDHLREAGEPFIVDLEEGQQGLRGSGLVSLERLVRVPFLDHNDVELLIDGTATFDAIFEAIDGAQDYVLLQFFIVKADDIGKKLAAHLIAARERGVRVYFLFDEIGSRKLSASYLRELRGAGAEVKAFSTTRQSHRLQLNFRNHRKIVVADGRVALTGGINVGDEYLGHHQRLSPWRDTFVRVTGPAVQVIQLSFLEDWHWATDEIPEWNWDPAAAPSGRNRSVLVLPTGPADPMETCSLVFVGLIHGARERLWIATPYFVFDSQVTTALQVAALRGVDVRIIVPGIGDHRSTFFAGWSYYDEVLESGARILKYGDGFPHQKVVLVDDSIAMVGSANLDNRSMRLNFELGVLVEDRDFASEVEAMLQADLDRSTDVRRDEFGRKSFFFRLTARFARLFAPIL